MRLACNSEKIYQAVVEQVKHDIDQMNDASKFVHFDTLEEGRTFIIAPQGRNAERLGVVKVRCNSHSVQVENDSSGVEGFLIKWAWNQATASCDLSVNGATMKLWQISQKALYPIFFPGDADVRAPVN